MARSKHATKEKVTKPPVVKPAWATNQTNINNADFLQPSEFVLPKNLLLEILGRIPCRYTHKDYMLTARIVMQLEKQAEEGTGMLDGGVSGSQDVTPDASKSVDAEADAKKQHHLRAKPKHGAHEAPRMKRFGSRVCMRRCIYLTTLTIKYSQILRQLLEASDFFSVHPDLRDDTALVRVILCDFLDRQLELRIPFAKEELTERCALIENALKDMHIRICADFARMRIKMRAPFLPDMLDDKVKELDKAVRKMPLYAWVNYLLVTKSAAIDMLQAAGFSFCPTASARTPPRSIFQPDLHCPDVFMFNRLDADELDCNPIFKKHKLNFGDKLESLALHLVIARCNSKTTIALVNPNSTSLAVHAESLYMARHGKESTRGRKAIRIILTRHALKSVDDEIHRLGESGATSISIYEDVVNAGKWPSSDLVVVYGCSSMTGIIDPLEYLIFSERADSAMLYSVLEYNHNDILDSQTPAFLRTNLECMKHAFEMPGIQSAFFLAHSIRSAETAQLVQKSIDLANHKSQGASGLTWGMVMPVDTNFKQTDYIGLTAQHDGIFVSPSKECNGGFIAVIERQLTKLDAMPPPTKEGGKKGQTAASNANNKFRNPGRTSIVQQNLHNRAKSWREKKWMSQGGMRSSRFLSRRLRYAGVHISRPPGQSSTRDSQSYHDSKLARGRKDQRFLSVPTAALVKRRQNMDLLTSWSHDPCDLEVLELSAAVAKF